MTHDILLHAPWGSDALLTAVEATMDTIDDGEFAAIIEERERLHGRDLPPLAEPERKYSMAGRAILRPVRQISAA